MRQLISSDGRLPRRWVAVRERRAPDRRRWTAAARLRRTSAATPGGPSARGRRAGLTALLCGLALACSERKGSESSATPAAEKALEETAPTKGRLAELAAKCKAAPGARLEMAARCKAFSMFRYRERATLDRYDPVRPETLKPFVGLMDEALALLAAEDPWERAIAHALLEQGMLRTQYKPIPQTEAWLGHVAERLTQASDDHERATLLRLLGNFAGGESREALLRVAREAESAAVRGAAWTAMARCAPRGCTMTPDAVRAAYTAETDPAARAGVVVMAGRLKLPELLEWCAEPLKGDATPMVAGCRRALRRLDDPKAFEMLKARAERLLAAADVLPRDLADALADLVPFADVPPTRDAFFALMENTLLADEVSPFVVGRVGARLRFVTQFRAEARELLTKIHRTFQPKWVEGDPIQQHAVKQVERSIRTLGGGGGDGHAGHGHGGRSGKPGTLGRPVDPRAGRPAKAPGGEPGPGHGAHDD